MRWLGDKVAEPAQKEILPQASINSTSTDPIPPTTDDGARPSAVTMRYVQAESVWLLQRIGDTALKCAARHDVAQISSQGHKRLRNLGPNTGNDNLRAQKFHRLGRT